MSSTTLARQWRVIFPWRPVLIFTLGLLAIVAAALTPADFKKAPAIREIQFAPAITNAPPAAGAEWDGALWWKAPYFSEARWVKTIFSLNAEEAAQRSLSLRLSGPFSASVWLNGAFIGAKGTPAGAGEREKPGKIDARFLVHDDVRSGENILLMKVSSKDAGYRPARLFQELALTNDFIRPQRSMTRYWLSFSLMGLFAGTAFYFVRIYCAHSRNAFVLWAAAAAGFLFLAASAEISRSFVNYAYPFHVARLFLIWLFFNAFGAALCGFIATRFAAPGARRIIIGAISLSLCAALFLTGGDQRICAALFIYAAAGILLLARSDERTPTMLFAAALSPILLAATITPWSFLDNAVYLLGAIMLGVIAVDLIDDRTADAAPASPPMQALEIDGLGRVSLASIRAVHAAGNYAEINFVRNKKNRLVRSTLATIAERASGLRRVHRSHLANLEYAKTIRRDPNGRFWLIMDDESRTPVSREQAKTLTQYFKDREG